MDRINKFLEKRQQKHKKNIKYKNKSYTITKEDLKAIRAYKSSKCLDESLKSIPNRILSFSSKDDYVHEAIQKKDLSDYFNNQTLRTYLRKNRKPKVIPVPINEIEDLFEDENMDSLRNYIQEWKYSITTAYEGPVEDLKFTKEDLEQEIKRVYMNHFRPRDPRSKFIRDILPKLPDPQEMRPFPEYASYSWETTGKCQLFNSFLCMNNQHKLTVKDLKTNKVTVEHEFEEKLQAVYINKEILVATKNKIFIYKNGIFEKIIETKENIKDVYTDGVFIGYLTGKSIVLHDAEDFSELKILKLKGDIPGKMKIASNIIYASTHKGILVESEEKTEIKNLGYVVDFVENNGQIYAINNVSRLITVSKSLKVVGNTTQSSLGLSLKIQPFYNLLAILYATEIGIYKIEENRCVPINTIEGSFKSIDWDGEMPWLYASGKNQVMLFT